MQDYHKRLYRMCSMLHVALEKTVTCFNELTGSLLPASAKLFIEHGDTDKNKSTYEPLILLL